MIKKLVESIKGLFKSKEPVLTNEKIIAPSSTVQKEQSIKEAPATVRKKRSSKKLRKPIDASVNQHLTAKNKKASSKQKLNLQSTLEKINEVNKLREEKNITIAEACHQAGVAPSYYYKLRDKA